MATIAISTYYDQISWGPWRRRAAFVPETYLQLVRLAGHQARLLAPGIAPSPAKALEGCEGLIVAGGPDVDPSRYRAEPLPRTDPPQVERDAWELGLLEAAITRSIPTLGVCRGMQLMNVHFGGTLHQHLPDTVGHDDHRAELGRFGQHVVRLTEGSPIGAVLGRCVTVPTYHHQGIDRLGLGLEAVGFADDGTVEAFIHREHRFVWGVQWHPEEDCETGLLQGLLSVAGAGVPA